MFRSILGFAVFAVAVWLVLKIVFGLLGTVVGLALTILWLAAIGYVLYLVVRLFSPATAAKVRDLIKGWPRTVV
jgi:thiol:disulfide interchange protein